MEYNLSFAASPLLNAISKPQLLSHTFIEIKKTCDCSLSELYYFFLLLKKGNKVSLIDLFQKIYNCEFLGFCYMGKRLVGISAIKRPSIFYVKQIQLKAGIERNANDFIFEVGYSFTEADVRRIGISSTLKGMLQDKITHYHGMIFSTTATPSSQRYLKSKGFRSCGSPYHGNFDSNIIYFEKSLSIQNRQRIWLL